MAPLDDLVHAFLIAFENSLDATIPAIFNPTFYPKPKSRFLSVVAKEDSLNPPFDDDVCSHLFHIDLARMCPAGPSVRVGSRGTF